MAAPTAAALGLLLGLALGSPGPARSAQAQAGNAPPPVQSPPAMAQGIPAARPAPLPDQDADAAAVAIFAALEGDARLLRDRSRFRPTPGTGLRALDIVETGPTGFVQIAFRDGSTLALGPSTRVMLGRRPQRGIAPSVTVPGQPSVGRSAAGDPLDVLYLLAGWIKRIMPARNAPDDAPGFSWATPLGDIHAGRGAAIGHLVDGLRLRLFAEAGGFSFVPSLPVSSRAEVRVLTGQLLRRDGSDAPFIDERGTADFLEAIPAAFRVPLPVPAPALLASPRPATSPGPLDGRELEPWLRAEPRLRGLLSEIWRSPSPIVPVAARTPPEDTVELPPPAPLPATTAVAAAAVPPAAVDARPPLAARRAIGPRPAARRTLRHPVRPSGRPVPTRAAPLRRGGP